MAKAWKLIMVASCLVCISRFAGAETKAFFSSQESLQQEMERLIDASRSSIDIALFEFRLPRLTQALERARSRGVTLRLILDSSHREEESVPGDVRWLSGKSTRGRGVMHHKFAIFDHKQVVTGSYNWTPGAEYSNYENALLTDDSGAVQAYSEEFERLWLRTLNYPPPISPQRRRPWRASGKKSRRYSSSKSVRMHVLRLVPPKL